MPAPPPQPASAATMTLGRRDLASKTFLAFLVMVVDNLVIQLAMAL
jgi:hypothetical protein